MDFTCIIPAYNRERTIGRAIESALGQTMGHPEVIVVEDGSTDGTASVAASFEPHITCITQSNSGGAVARNTGARAASTRWIAFLDSDDYWQPEHLARMNAAIHATDGRAAYYFGDLQRTEAEGGTTQWDRANFRIDGDWEMIEDGTPWLLRSRMPMMLQGSCFDRVRFLEKGGLWGQLRRRHDTHAFLLHGLGQPICAVKGVGTVMTSDEQGERLTAELTPETLGYHGYSIMLWADILGRFPDLQGKHRSRLRYRLSRSHLSSARLEAQGGRLGHAAAHFVKALRTSPSYVLRSLSGRRRSELELFES